MRFRTRFKAILSQTVETTAVSEVERTDPALPVVLSVFAGIAYLICLFFDITPTDRLWIENGVAYSEAEVGWPKTWAVVECQSDVAHSGDLPKTVLQANSFIVDFAGLLIDGVVMAAWIALVGVAFKTLGGFVRPLAWLPLVFGLTLFCALESKYWSGQIADGGFASLSWMIASLYSNRFLILVRLLLCLGCTLIVFDWLKARAPNSDDCGQRHPESRGT